MWKAKTNKQRLAKRLKNLKEALLASPDKGDQVSSARDACRNLDQLPPLAVGRPHVHRPPHPDPTQRDIPEGRELAQPTDQTSIADAGGFEDGNDWLMDEEPLPVPDEFRVRDPLVEEADADEPGVASVIPAEIERRNAESEEDIGMYLASMQARREVPIAVMSDIVAYLNENRELVAQTLADNKLKSFRMMRHQALQCVPTVWMDAVAEDANGQQVVVRHTDSYPRKEFASRGLRPRYLLHYVSLDAVFTLHESLHGDGVCSPEFDLSLDGIPENRSSGLSLDILSIRMTDCRSVYTLAVLKPFRKAMQIPDSVILAHFLEDYKKTTRKLRYVIADAPKRAALQGLKQHSAAYACPYCKAKKIQKAYPPVTADAPLRTDAELRALGQVADAGEVDDDVLFGVKGSSPLRDIDIDLIRNIPAEKMHMCDLGIVRKILQLSYKCAAYKNKDVPIMRVDDSRLTERLLAILSLPEFSRRTRPVDFPNYKGEEFRNLVLCFWPAVADTLPMVVVPLWLLTVFLVRACTVPDRWFARFSESYDLVVLERRWFAMFHRVFTAKLCSYYVHVFGSHLHLVRETGPLTKTAAVVYESHYNILKKSCRAGTASLGRQAISNTMLATRYKHACRRSKKLTARVTSATDDKYCFMADGTIVRAQGPPDDDGKFEAVKVCTEPGFYPIQGLDFTKILVFKLGINQEGAKGTYHMQDVDGKCVRVGNVLSVMPWDVLHES